MKSLAWFGAAGLLASCAAAQAPADRPAIKPIESLWLTPAPTGGLPAAESLKQCRRVFDWIMLVKMPPTFAEGGDFSARANAVMKDVGGAFALVTLPVGNRGWETSNNQRLAEREGGHFDAAKSMAQAEWLATLEPVHTDTWVWILEQPARIPSPEQAVESAGEFVRFAKQHHKRPIIWLSAQALNPRFREMTGRVCEATRADAEFFGWMDIPGELARAGQDHWRTMLDGILDQILALTPAEKTIIQYSHAQQSLTGDPAGTLAYFAACQAKGINRFCLFSQPQFIEREPWRDFYRTLAKRP